MRLNGSNRAGFFYGYIVVIAGFIILTLAYGAVVSFGVFLKTLSADFGWTRATTSGAYSTFMFVHGLLFILTGALNDRFGPRIVVTVSVFFLGLGFLLMSQVVALWQIYLLYGVLIAIGGSGGFVPMGSTVVRWFVKRRGLMTGVTLSGVGAGVVIGPPVAGWLIASFGWRTAYYVIGMVILSSLTLISQFLRRDPSKLGQLPYGENEVKQKGTVQVSPDFSFREVIFTRQFWVLLGVNVFWGIILNATLIHIVPYATDLGISEISAASILSVVGGLNIVGRIVICGFADRIGSKSSLVIGFILLLAALFSLQFAKDLGGFYFSAVFFGLAYGGLGAVMSPMVAELFGMMTHGTIFGVIIFTQTMGGAIGPYVAGYIFDATNSYYFAFLSCAILSVFCLMLTLFLKPTT